MLVQMASYPGSGNISLIHAYIEAMRSPYGLQDFHGLLCQRPVFEDLCLVSICVIWDMTIRHNKKMT
jgi:hypothetical protein